jgi:hypothetical protein
MGTPAQKAAQTRRYNKAYTAHEERIAPSEAAFKKVLDEQCPKRDAKIAAAEARLEQARLIFERECQEIQSEFESLIESDSKIRDAAHDKSYEIFHQEAYPDSFTRSA